MIPPVQGVVRTQHDLTSLVRRATLIIIDSLAFVIFVAIDEASEQK